MLARAESAQISRARPAVAAHEPRGLLTSDQFGYDRYQGQRRGNGCPDRRTNWLVSGGIMPNTRTSKLAVAVRSLCTRRRHASINDIGLAALAAVSLWGGTAEAQDSDSGTSRRRGDHGHRLAAAPRRHVDTHARDRARHPRDAANGADVAHGLARPAAAVPRQRAVAVGQHLHERRRLASRQLARHRHESNADAAQRPAAWSRDSKPAPPTSPSCRRR